MNTPPAWHSRCRPAFMAQQDDFCYKARFLVWSLCDGFCDHQVVQDFSDHCDLSRPLRKQLLGLGVPNWAELRSPVSSKMLLKLWNFHIVSAKATNSCESWHVEIGYKVYVRSASSLFWSDLECCRCGRCPRSSYTSLASCRFESKPCSWLRAPGRTARVPHWILRLLWRCSISKWVFKADVEDSYEFVSHFFVQCNHFASCKMGGLLKDGGKHFSGVDEVGPQIAEMLNCNALFVSGCVEAAWDQNLRRFRGLFLAVAYIKSYFLIYSFWKSI